jgi:hypothetical protein
VGRFTKVIPAAILCWFMVSAAVHAAVISTTVTGLVVTSSADFVTCGQVGGPFPARSQSYTLDNFSADTITWAGMSDADWIEITPSGGDIEPGESVDVVVGIDPVAANGFSGGEYSADILFRNLTEESEDRHVHCTLSIALPEPGLFVSPGDDFVARQRADDPFQPNSTTYTISNTSDEPFVWRASASADWLSLTSPGGELAPGESTQLIVYVDRSVVPSMGPGEYAGSVDIANVTTGVGATSRTCNLSLAATSPLAINPMVVTDWTTEQPFKDAFKEARGWISHQGSVWSSALPLDLDSDGWVRSLVPTQAAGTLMFNGNKGRYPAGQYTVLYEGSGTIVIGHDATVVSSQPGKITIQVNHPTDAGIYLKITATTPSNYIKNIRVVMPGQLATYATQPFNPVFLDIIKDFSVLRFMDWGRTNNSPLVNWSDRATGTSAFQSTEKGVSVEWMVALANTTMADPWFCMPHRASDDYVTRFATFVRDNLAPGRKVYVEYSNEVWNGQFSQAQYAQQQGVLQGLSTNAFQAQLRYYSKRSVEVFNLWKTVFGSQSSRVVRVLAGQAGNPWTGQTIMEWNNANQSADVYAVAPYFGGVLGNASTQAQVSTWSLSRLFDELRTNMVATMATNAQNIANAQARGLPLITYEGGQHLVGVGGAENNATLSALFMAANRDPRMGQLYTDYLNSWKSQGGQLFAVFNCVDVFSKWGSWGMLEFMDANRLRAHKYVAIVNFVAQNPKWW